MSRVRGSVYGKLPRGDIKGRAYLQNHHNRIFAKGRSTTYTSKTGDEELDPSKDNG